MSEHAVACRTLEDRIAQLETLVTDQQRRLRRHRAIGLSALLLLSAGAMTAAVAQRAVPQVLQAQRLEIVGADGKLLMAAGAGVNGGRLEMIDKKGNVSLACQATVHGGQLDVWTAGGANVLRAGANEHGGDLAMWNTKGQNVLGAYATAQGGESAIWSADGKPMFKASANEDAPGGKITVFAGDGKRSFAAAAEQDGCGRIDVFNNANNAVFTVDGQKDKGCAVVLANNVGTRLFMLGTQTPGGLMNFYNDRGEIKAIFGVAPDGSGALDLMNSSGMEIVKAGSNENRDGFVEVRDGANAMKRVLRP